MKKSIPGLFLLIGTVWVRPLSDSGEQTVRGQGENKTPAASWRSSNLLFDLRDELFDIVLIGIQSQGGP